MNRRRHREHERADGEERCEQQRPLEDPRGPYAPRLAGAEPRGGDDDWNDGENGEDVREYSRAPDVPVAAAAVVIERDEAGVDKRGRERRKERRACDEDGDPSKGVEMNRRTRERAHADGTDQCLERVADEPAEHHGHRNAGAELYGEVRRKDGGDENWPATRRREQQRREEDRVRWPERRNRLFARDEQEAGARAEIVRDGQADGREVTARRQSADCVANRRH